MSKNEGKLFEQDFQVSFPSAGFIYRLKDAGGFSKSENKRFTINNMCDFLGFYRGFLCCFELKSTKLKSLPIKNIRNNQLVELYEASLKDNVKSYIVINFRTYEETYAVDIKDIKEFYEKMERKSISLDYCREVGIKIEQEKKRVRYKYNLEGFFEELV